MANRYHIPHFGDMGTLDGTNYPLWKMKVRSHLVLRESWKIATRVEQKLEVVIIPNYNDYVDGDDTNRYSVNESMID